MNLFQKQNKPFAIKLSDRVKEEIKKEFGVNLSNYKLSEYFIFISKDNWTFSLNKPPYTLITEAEFFGDGNELTPMQELIEMCETLIKNSSNKAVYEAINVIKFRAKKELLLKEKQLHEHFYEQGIERGQEVSFEDYYNQKIRKDE